MERPGACTSGLERPGACTSIACVIDCTGRQISSSYEGARSDPLRSAGARPERGRMLDVRKIYVGKNFTAIKLLCCLARAACANSIKQPAPCKETQANLLGTGASEAVGSSLVQVWALPSHSTLRVLCYRCLKVMQDAAAGSRASREVGALEDEGQAVSTSIHTGLLSASRQERFKGAA